MEKIREWLLMKISLFKKPLTNYQIPQNALLKNRFFYEFLLANDREVAREVSVLETPPKFLNVLLLGKINIFTIFSTGF